PHGDGEADTEQERRDEHDDGTADGAHQRHDVDGARELDTAELGDADAPVAEHLGSHVHGYEMAVRVLSGHEVVLSCRSVPNQAPAVWSLPASGSVPILSGSARPPSQHTGWLN